MANGSNDTGFIAGLIVGGLIGFATGIMLAPKSGEETRAQLWDSTGDVRERLDEVIETAQVRLDDMRDEASRISSRAREAVRQRVASTSTRPESADSSVEVHVEGVHVDTEDEKV